MCAKKTVVILQSSYIPWKGYFDLIRQADEFIIYDDVQFTKRDWRNRNVIKTPAGEMWLTIPVEQKGNYYQTIDEVKISDQKWAAKHWKSLTHNYAKAPFFGLFKSTFEEVYLSLENESYLSQVNYNLIVKINQILGIKTKLSWSKDYGVQSDLKSSDRILALCKQSQATEYLSGPSAKNYLDEEMFEEEGIQVKYIDYSKYRPYPQLYSGFIHGVTILDLIFNAGLEASSYIEQVNG